MAWVLASVLALELVWAWELESELPWVSESELVSAWASRSVLGLEMRKRGSVSAAGMRLARDSASVSARKVESRSAPT